MSDKEQGKIMLHEMLALPKCSHEWPKDRPVKDNDVCPKCGTTFLQHVYMECE